MTDKQKNLEMYLWKPEEDRIMGVAESLEGKQAKDAKFTFGFAIRTSQEQNQSIIYQKEDCSGWRYK